MKKVVLSFVFAVFGTGVAQAAVQVEFSGLSGPGYSISAAQVEAGTVILDARPRDGDLKIGLENGDTLIVTSGFSPNGVQYFVNHAGSQIELKPYLNFKKN